MQLIIDFSTMLLAFSLLVVFIYQMSVLLYASKLLMGGTSNKILFVFLSVINTTLFWLYNFYNLNFYLLILGLLVVLIIEFKIISKANFIQFFCGASIFVLHISAFVIPLITILGSILNLSPHKVITESDFGLVILIASCIFLMIAQEIVKKHIDNVSIQRVTTQGKYSLALFVATITVVLFQLVHAALMITDEIYNSQMLLSITVSLVSLSVFYLCFLYAINLIDANLYKRNSDKEVVKQEEIYKQKEDLLKKIERDELTGVYNRKYVLSLLEKMCEEESDDKRFCVLFIDVNALKYTNDTYGHKAGDRLITRIVNAIQNAVRECDVVARIGGDEFLIVVNEIETRPCIDLVQRIKYNIENQNKLEEFLVSASIGSVCVDEEIKKLGLSQILSMADEDMRKNKENFYKTRKGELK